MLYDFLELFFPKQNYLSFLDFTRNYERTSGIFVLSMVYMTEKSTIDPFEKND